MTSVLWTAVGCAALLITGYAISGCGQGGGTTSGMSQLTTTITDPAECSAAVGGNYEAAEVTITDVQANVNGSASASGSGWVDLTPGLKPTQINLLGSNASGGCFLASLGDNLEVQAGDYKQIRLILGTNGKTMVVNNVDTNDSTNSCTVSGTGLPSDTVNCVEDSKGMWHALTTPSAQETGIKIVPSQLSGGSLNLAAGQTEDLVINFQTCESILQAGNSGKYILQPVLNAGQVSTNSTTINGTVADSNGNPINGPVMVSLEQPDSNGVDRIKYTTMTAKDGTFSFCSVLETGSPTGSFDVVVSADAPSSTPGAAPIAYETAVVTGVQLGETTGTIKLMPSTNSTATLTGLASTQGGSPAAGVSTLMSFYPLEANPVTTSTTKFFTVPLLQTTTNSNAYLSQETTTGPSYTDAGGTVTNCPSGTDCATFSMTVPQSGISVYNYSSSGPVAAGTVYSTPLASYTVDAQAFQLNTNPEAPDCTKTELTTSTGLAITAGSTAGVTLAANTTTPPLNFTGCQ